MRHFAIAGFAGMGLGVVVACGGVLAPSEASPPGDSTAPENDSAGSAKKGDPNGSSPAAGVTADGGKIGLADAAANTDTGAAGDGAADAGPFCDPAQSFSPAFSPAVDVPGLESPPGGPPRTNVRLTSDELRAVYARATSGAGGSWYLCEATRASPAAAFGSERAMYELAGGGVGGYGSLSDDGLVIYFNGWTKYPPGDGSFRTMFTSQRASVSLPFEPRASIEALPTSDIDVAPYLVGTDLWFSRLGATDFDIFHVSLLGGAAAIPVQETELDEPNVHDVNPVVSADGLTVFFARGTVPPGTSFVSHPRIMEARRATLGSPFTIHETCELNTTGDERPTWLSPDGCRLYFTSNYRVRVASRCAP